MTRARPGSGIQGQRAKFHLKQKIFISENLHASDMFTLTDESG